MRRSIRSFDVRSVVGLDLLVASWHDALRAATDRNVRRVPGHHGEDDSDGGVMSGFQTATFGAGCFWGVEWVFRRVPGVTQAVSGYAGGHTPSPTYRDVCSHTTGHAEVVQVTFDPSVVTYDQLLEVFWALHDPTQVNRQGPDVGDQYRSVIMPETDEQQAAAEASCGAAQARFDRPIATTIEPLDVFYPAEEFHQEYYEKNGHEPYCHVFPGDVVERLGLVTKA
jgi:peptide-methionine (S)-S-oxide reductase